MDLLHLVYVLTLLLGGSAWSFLLDEPQKILKHSSSLFSCELRADANIAKGRSVLLIGGHLVYGSGRSFSQ
jgi:hypothetical protein